MAAVSGVIPGPRFYRPELDGLRFFAFLLVFFQHFPEPSSLVPDWFPFATALKWMAIRLNNYGWFGVDLFFVLSGYLLTELLNLEKQSGAVGIRRFYIRRALRIWPLYFVALLLGFAVLPALAYGTGRGQGLEAWGDLVGKHLLPFALFGGNQSIIAYGYPRSHILAPLWSVSVEEQFYLVLPWVIALCDRRRQVRTALGFVGLALLVRVAAVAFDKGFIFLWVFTLARLDAFALGMLVSCAFSWRRFSVTPIVQAGLLALSGGMLVGVVAYDPMAAGHLPHAFIWAFPVVDLAFATVLFAVTANVTTTGVRWLQTPTLAWLGKLSYGLYVFHQLALYVAGRLVAGNYTHNTTIARWVAYLVAGLSLTVGFATVSYYGLERPFLRMKRRFSAVQSRPV